ncbi:MULTISPECIES: hypothetical protein [unclassified Leucobacter]|uniref:hypothetical protein n=1 Tax=unclassified Leucobacter TaxID=2621730 RepID=UPI003019562D
MDPLILTASVAVVIVSGTYLVLTLRAEARRRKRERALAEMLELANDALTADLSRRNGPVAGMVEIDPSSPLGRELLEQIRMGCECPNCEESRRIAHAEQQKRGEQ